MNKTKTLKNKMEYSSKLSPKMAKKKIKARTLRVAGAVVINSAEEIKCLHKAAKRQKLFDFSNVPRTDISDEEDGRDYATKSNLWNFNSTLTDKSKEEKLRFDVEMYRRNEKAFEHDVRRFMDRQGCRIKCLPVWQNTPISLFQLFISVFEQGGFQQVTENKGWPAVYRELTNQSSTSNGTIAKNYYQRNLLPYEFYLRGKDYHNAMFWKANKRHNCHKQHQDLANDSDCGSCEELEAMLESLEEESHLCCLDDDTATVPALPRPRLPSGLPRGVDVLFYDESPEDIFSPGVKVADTASEFGKPNLPGDSPPDSNPETEDEVLSEDHTDYDEDSVNSEADNDTDDELLQDLQNVQHQISLLHDQLMIEE